MPDDERGGAGFDRQYKCPRGRNKASLHGVTPDIAAPASPDDVAKALERTGYLPGTGIATAAYLAKTMARPLFCEGEPGTGKTALASALAEGLELPLIRLQCFEGIDAAQALYEWDFARQLLHLRALEAASDGSMDSDAAEQSIYTRRFLLVRPLLQALTESPCVLLVDEIDRADDEFEAFLLQLLDENAVTIPELGRIEAQHAPIVVLTSNRTREVHDALKRRCLYHWLEHPDLAREIAILRSRVADIDEQLATQVATAVRKIRELELLKPPGVAESIDWARALLALDCSVLDAESATHSLGAVLKYREDADRVQAAGIDTLLAG